VQEDRSNPRPCTKEDKERFGEDGLRNPYNTAPAPTVTATPSATPSAKPGDDDDLMKQMLGDTGKKPDDKPKNDDDDLMKQMMGAGSATPSASAVPSAKPSDANDDLLKEMMGEPKKK
jgi:hypothetical protein